MSERHTIKRDLGFIRGAKFFREGDAVLFVFGLDPNNLIGPRKATNADKIGYPGEWAAFAATDADGDGHSDATGEFVSPQPPKNRGGRPRKVITDG